MSCSNCQSPERILYGPGKRPALTNIHLGNWIDLVRCELCGALWCLSPYEPYAAFEYLARWEFTADEWDQWHAADSGHTLRLWHAAMIREHWLGLAEDERARVDEHRRRSSGHNPIDNTQVFGAAEARSLLPKR